MTLITFYRRPVTCVYVSEMFTDPNQAIEWEKQVKDWNRKKKRSSDCRKVGFASGIGKEENQEGIEKAQLVLDKLEVTALALLRFMRASVREWCAGQFEFIDLSRFSWENRLRLSLLISATSRQASRFNRDKLRDCSRIYSRMRQFERCVGQFEFIENELSRPTISATSR